MEKLPLFSMRTRKRVAYALLAAVLLVYAGSLVWVLAFQRTLPLVILSPMLPMWIAIPFIILGSVAREEKGLREGKRLEVSSRQTWLFLSLGTVSVLIIGLGALLMVRHGSR